MAKTKIEWATDSWNVITGCNKVSQGCKFCYAETYAHRFWGYRDFTEVRFHREKLNDIEKWKKPRRVFVNSMSDLFHEQISFLNIARIFGQMFKHKKHKYIILTKRPERMKKFVEWKSATVDFRNYGNIWLGVSVEDQLTADIRIPALLNTPAAVRIISYEPALGVLDLSKHIEQLDWVIAGGESGTHARPAHSDWFKNIRNECMQADVPLFFKQWGEWVHTTHTRADLEHINTYDGVKLNKRRIHEWQDGTLSFKIGKKRAGNLLQGERFLMYPGDKYMLGDHLTNINQILDGNGNN